MAPPFHVYHVKISLDDKRRSSSMTSSTTFASPTSRRMSSVPVITKGISILLGVEDALTPQFVATEELGPDSKLFKIFPNAYNAIHGNNQ
uniref:Uncharacterized protein n=1 Tax=Panagrellus redivivus TaxID=6233 RepID=A0A7E4V667_PANRE